MSFAICASREAILFVAIRQSADSLRHHRLLFHRQQLAEIISYCRRNRRLEEAKRPL